MSRQIKANFISEYFKNNSKDFLTFVNKSIQEKNISEQNNKYRSSSPWYLLLNESSKFQSVGEYTKNNKFACGFQIKNQNLQKLIDAAFSKCYYMILDDEIIDPDEINEKIINYIDTNKILNKSPRDVISTYKKLTSEVLELY